MLLLLACAPTDDELRAVLEANTAVLEGVHLGLEALEVKVDRHTKGDGRYAYDGVLGPGLGWTEGSVTVTGESVSEEDGALQTYDLDLVYRQVQAGPLLDGSLAWEMVILTADGRLDLDYRVQGTLRVDDAWDAVLDLGRDVTPTDDGFDEAWSGTLNDADVSELMR